MPRKTSSSTGAIERNRPPRVHIAYDLETNGAQRKVDLPFIMGVIGDFSGNVKKEDDPVSKRHFADVSADTLDKRMKEIQPHLQFSVPLVIGTKGQEEENIIVDLTFEKMEDFSPEAVAKKIKPINDLLKVREQLTNLLSWTDGRGSAEDFLLELAKNKPQLEAIAQKRVEAPTRKEADED